MRRLVDLDQRSRLRVHEVDRQQQAGAGRLQHRDVALEAGVDRLEDLERCLHRLDERAIASSLGDALEADVTLLAQPVERPALEHDPVVGRGLREGEMCVASPAHCSAGQPQPEQARQRRDE